MAATARWRAFITAAAAMRALSVLELALATATTGASGPHWNVEADGVAATRFRALIGAGVEAIANADGFATDLLDDFGYRPRRGYSATRLQHSDFGLQIGYEGINNYKCRQPSSPPMALARTTTYGDRSTLDDVQCSLEIQRDATHDGADENLRRLSATSRSTKIFAVHHYASKTVPSDRVIP